jgi:hypothetical protein
MAAVLSSPRFLFKLESPAPHALDAQFADVDEYSLASRLSYFLWSTMPDRQLLDLAARGELRQQLAVQVKRMLADWEKAHPGRSETIFRAMGNIAPSQLTDRKLFDFAALGARDGAVRADTHAWLAGGDAGDDND